MHTVRKVVTNDSAETVQVGLEPWGMYLSLEPGRAFEIVAEAPEAGELEIVRGAAIVAYAWSGATLKVYCDGELIHAEGLAVPDAPPGMSTRDFMSLVGLDEIK